MKIKAAVAMVGKLDMRVCSGTWDIQLFLILLQIDGGNILDPGGKSSTLRGREGLKGLRLEE